MKTQDIVENCWLRTFTGKVIDPTNVKESDIDLIDIGHALSLICRFGGHANSFYCVAEHCLLVYELIKLRNPVNLFLQLEGLMHDSSEAYLVDLPTPFKRLLPDYKKLEEKVTKVINKKFGLVGSSLVKEYDKEALVIEMTALFDGVQDPRIHRYTPEVAFALFISTANRLKQEINND